MAPAVTAVTRACSAVRYCGARSVIREKHRKSLHKLCLIARKPCVPSRVLYQGQ